MRLPEIGVRIGRGPRWSASQRRTSSGLEVRLVLLMSDHRRKEFESVEAIRRMKGVRLGIGAGRALLDEHPRDSGRGISGQPVGAFGSLISDR